MPTVFGAIVLCGGESRRMGTSKAILPFGDEPMLRRIVRIVREAIAAGPIVVVASVDQELPTSADDVVVVRDEHERRGPLEGLRAGFRALAGRCEAAYATSCDVPLLQPPFVRLLCDSLGPFEAAVAEGVGRLHPLAGAYRVAPAQRRLAELSVKGERRAMALVAALQSRIVCDAELRAVDAELASLRNVNDPEEYESALRDAGFSVDRL